MQFNQEIVRIVETAMALQTQGRAVEATEIYDRLLARITYDDPNLLMGYGTLLASQGYYGVALQLLHKAVAVAPQYAYAWANLGTALRSVERLTDAEAAHAKALALEPGNSFFLTNMAGAYVNRNMAAKVVEFAQKAIAADPSHANAHVHLALGLLEQGKFDEAWPHYEYRWKMAERQNDVRPYTAPRWNGEHVGTLAIHGEQGLGDEIMFMACYREAAKRADRVVIECAPRLVNLFRRSFGVPCYATHDELIAAEGEPDAYIPMGSLPAVVGLPLDGRPYLARAEGFGAQNRRPLIGLSWRGGAEKTNQTLRSIPLVKFTPVLCNQAVDFVSLQYGDDDVDMEARDCDVLTLPDRNFATIADALSRCDLVISVCQTNVHLAGAFGVQCWVLTPGKASWRYCRDRMEWYDGVELFKRKEGQNWDAVIERAATALRARYADAA